MAEVDLAEYLFTRLRQIGVGSVHGVPGDYNLTALDYISQAGLDWVGNCNELNAGYAADGYARINGVGAVITAFGVGELSTINAIGGAYAEHVPLVHVVGTPATSLQASGACLHHSLGDGNFRVFAEMQAKVTVAQANLTDPNTAPAMIDRTLRECLMKSRPVYIELPTDMVQVRVSSASLSQPIDTSVAPNDEGFESEEVDLILERMYAAKQPFIIVDGLTPRYGYKDEANELVRLTGFPTSTTPFGKGIVDETLPNFHGVYAGVAGQTSYMPWVQSCDLVLHLGSFLTDINTFGFSTIPAPGVTISFHRESVHFGNTVNDGTHYRDLHIKGLLRNLINRLDVTRIVKLSPYPDLGNPRAELEALSPTTPSSLIDQETFYRRVSTLFRPGDIILTETGTPSVGGRDFVLPPSTTLINSSLWLSIGYMLAATQGVALAQREQINAGTRPPGSRAILFEGDGSFQMTAQELSTIIRKRLDVTIFLINNDGYTIERYIHGMDAAYNDVAPWRYLDAPRFFGGRTDDPEYEIQTHRVANWGELNNLLHNNDSFARSGSGLKMVEVLMARDDAPDSLKKLVQGAAERNRGSKKRGSSSESADAKTAAAQEESKIVQEVSITVAG